MIDNRFNKEEVLQQNQNKDEFIQFEDVSFKYKGNDTTQ